LGTKDKLGRFSVGKDDVKLMPRWGARALFEPEMKIKKTSSNPGLASLTLRKKLTNRLKKRGIVDETVLNAITVVERHQFVDSALASLAYEDLALPIGFKQTISQPFVVARTISIVRELLSKNMSEDELAQLNILEVGCGSGYQAAVLSKCFGKVTSVERIHSLYEKALKNCEEYISKQKLKLHFYDGKSGFDDGAPYDAIFFSASLEKFPDELIDQVKDRGVVLAPTGVNMQYLLAGIKDLSLNKSFSISSYDVVSYVPLREGLDRF